MKGLIVSPDDRIEIKFVIGLDKKGSIIGDTTSEMLKRTYGEEIESGTIEDHSASFRRPTFGDLVKITGKISTIDGTGFDFSPLAIRLTRMKNLIKSWTLVNENGEEIPASEDSIDNLEPLVANVIGIQLDAALGGL